MDRWSSKVKAGLRAVFHQMLLDADPSGLLPRDEVEPSAPHIPQVAMQPDRPIKTAAEDLFDRATFARRVAAVIANRADDSSLVLGLFGPWGDGKTSTLGMLREALSEESVIIIEYNPWFYKSDAESITRAFFRTLGAALQKNPIFSRENIGLTLSTVGRAVPSIGEALGKLGDKLSEADLEAVKAKVGDILKRHQKRVVVFVDDIDRLDRKDIQTLFKLVRLVGDFAYTTYVLAFDDEIVAAALGEAYGGGDASAGARFLEKIIQVPLHLPPANRQILREVVFKSFDRVVAENSLTFDRDQGSELGNAFVAGFDPVLKTPRQAKLVDNAITFAVPILKGEVNVVDQILIECVRVFYPALYRLIRDNQSLFLGSGRSNWNSDDSERAELRNSLIADAMASHGLTEGEMTNLNAMLLQKLFPRTGRADYGADWEEQWGAEQRICSRDYFNRYFNYSVPRGDISDLSVGLLIADAERGSRPAVEDILRDAADRKALPLLTTKLMQRSATLPVQAIPSLTQAFAAVSGQMPEADGPFGSDWTRRRGATLLAKLIKRLPSAQWESAVSSTLSATDDAGFGIRLLEACRADKENNGEAGFLPEKTHRRLVDALTNSILAAASSLSLLEAVHQVDGFLFYVSEFASPRVLRTLRAKLKSELKSEPRLAILYTRAFTGTATSLGTGISRVGDFTISNYQSMARCFDMEQVYACLIELQGPKLSKAEYARRWDGDPSDPLQTLAQQFSYVHRHRDSYGKRDDSKDIEQTAERGDDLG